MVHYSIIIFTVIVLVLCFLTVKGLGSGRGGFGDISPIVGLFWFFILIIFVAVWGGFFWW